MLPSGFNDWMKKFPVSPEDKKRIEEFVKWLKKHNKPFEAKPMKIKVVYNVKALQEIKKIMQEHEVDFDRAF
jgi:hypothetical protein